MNLNQLSFTVLGAAAVCSTLAAAGPSVFEIRNYPEKIEEKIIREVKFEPEEKKFFRPNLCTVVNGAGVDRSHALKIEREPGSKKVIYTSVSLPAVVPGADYVVEVMARGENLKNVSSKRKFHFLSVESRIAATGKMAHWRDGTTRIYTGFPGKDFTVFKLNFKGKKGLHPFVTLTVPSGYAGSVYVDNLKVYQKGLPSSLKLTAPALQIFRSDNGKFDVSATPAKVADPLLLAVLHRNKKILRSVVVRPDMDNVFRGDFGKGLEAGDAGLLLIFADAANKVKLGVAEINCTIESME